MDLDNNNIIELKEVSLQLKGRKILENLDLEIEEEKITLILGKSGSGKSTLLNIMNMLYVPCQGEYYFKGQNVEFNRIQKSPIFKCEKH